MALALFGMIMSGSPIYELLAVLLLMDSVNGWLAVFVGLASHFLRSWISSDPELHQLRSDLAAFRSEVLRSELTVRRAGEALETCLALSSWQDWALRVVGFCLLQLLVGAGAIFIAYRKWEGQRSVDQPVVPTAPISDNLGIGETDDSLQTVKGSVVQARKGPLRPSDIRQLLDQNGGA